MDSYSNGLSFCPCVSVDCGSCLRKFVVLCRVQKSTSELMAAIQLGIGQSITILSTKPKRDLLLQDFSVVELVFFPR